MNHVRCSSQGRAWPLNNAYVVGSIPTLLVAQNLDQSGGSKEQREGDGLRNYLGVTLKIKWKL